MDEQGLNDVREDLMAALRPLVGLRIDDSTRHRIEDAVRPVLLKHYQKMGDLALSVKPGKDDRTFEVTVTQFETEELEGALAYLTEKPSWIQRLKDWWNK